jgi:hypothetical protein
MFIYRIRNILFFLYLAMYVLVVPFTFGEFVNSLIWHFATFGLLAIILVNNTYYVHELKSNLLFNLTFSVVMLINIIILGRFLFDTNLRIGNLNVWSLNEAYLNMNYVFVSLMIYALIIIDVLIIIKDKLTNH